MSIIFENEFGYYISHREYIDKLYKNIDEWNYYLNENLFHIVYPYKKKKPAKNLSNQKLDNFQHNEINIKLKFIEFMKILRTKNLLSTTCPGENECALEAAELAYQDFQS